MIVLLVAMVPCAVESQAVRAHRVAIVPFPTAEGLQYLRTFRTTMPELGYVEGNQSGARCATGGS